MSLAGVAMGRRMILDRGERERKRERDRQIDI